MPFRFALLALLLSASLCPAQERLKVGEPVGKLTFTDIRYVPRSLDDFGSKKAYALVFVNASCPLAKRYLPVLQALESEYRDKGVQFVAVDSAEDDSIVAMATLAVEHDVEFPFVKDGNAECAK